MNGTMKQTMMNGYLVYEVKNHDQDVKDDMNSVDTGKCSGFSMMAMAGALLMCVGIVLYALLTV